MQVSPIALAGLAVVSLGTAGWFLVWVLMEASVLLFMPPATTPADSAKSEGAAKYYLIQTAGGLFFLAGVLGSASLSPLVSFGLLLKLGLFPCQFWVPGVFSAPRTLSLGLASTLMKVPSLVALGVVVSSWLSVAAVINVVIGCVSGVMITSLKKLLAYSSLSHSGWLLLSLPSGWWVYYLACYTGLLLALLRGLSVSGALFSSQSLLLTPGLAPVILSLSLLSLAGLPPFSGFLLKWVALTKCGGWLGSAVLIPVVALAFSVFFYLASSVLSLMGSSPASKPATSPKAVGGLLALNIAGLPLLGLI